jgi:hypothetical protein
LVLAGAFAVLVCTLAMDRFGAVDELGLFNPVYTWIETGRMTYPAHYHFDRMVVHPPVHYLMVGLWMKAGVPLYYAEALPTILMHLLALVVIARSPFRWSIRVGLVTGLLAPILMFHHSRSQLEWFGMRPEGELNAAWLTGLMLLESGRQRGWAFWPLFAGTLALTYASTLHYYAAFSWMGAVMYAGWVIFRETWPVARRAVAAIGAGGLAVGIPFLALFVIPDSGAIRAMVDSVQRAGSGPLSAVQEHFGQFAFWQAALFRWKVLMPAALTGLGLILVSGIPAVFWLPLHWTLGREMRGLLLGSIPLLLFLLLFALRKHPYYYVHELTLASAGLVALGLSLLERAAARWGGRWKVLPAMSAGAIGILMPMELPRVADVTFNLKPRVHEMEVARAAALSTLGPRAVVGGRTGAWYIGGGHHWYGVDPEVYWNVPPLTDPVGFVRRFDAFVETYHMSNTSGPNGDGLSAWYASGMLRLKGFSVARPSNRTMSYVLLSAGSSSPIVGYMNQGERVLQFGEKAGGTSAAVIARCRAGTIDVLRDPPFSVWLLLPPIGDAPSDAILTAVVEGQQPLPEGCRELNRYQGTISVVTEEWLLSQARPLEAPIRFYTTGTFPHPSSHAGP